MQSLNIEDIMQTLEIPKLKYLWAHYIWRGMYPIEGNLHVTHSIADIKSIQLNITTL